MSVMSASQRELCVAEPTLMTHKYVCVERVTPKNQYSFVGTCAPKRTIGVSPKASSDAIEREGWTVMGSWSCRNNRGQPPLRSDQPTELVGLWGRHLSTAKMETSAPGSTKRCLSIGHSRSRIHHALRMTSPAIPAWGRCPWPLVAGEEPFSVVSGWANHIEPTRGTRHPTYESGALLCQGLLPGGRP